MKTWKVYLTVQEKNTEIQNEFYLYEDNFLDANKRVLEIIRTSGLNIDYCRITEVVE